MSSATVPSATSRPGGSIAPRPGSVRARRAAGRIPLYLLMLVSLLLVLAPFAYLLVSSIAPNSFLIARPLHWIPGHVSFHRYAMVLTGSGNQQNILELRAAFVNSLIIACSATVLAMLVGTLAAYGFARLEFRFRGPLILGFMITYMLPQVALFLPLYRVTQFLHLYNTRIALIVIYASMLTPFVIWLMRGYIETIPAELDDAARMDGCSRLSALWRVVLPIALPGLLSTALLAFLSTWDEFLYALVLTQTTAAETLPVAINNFIGRYGVDWGMMATAGVIASLPPLILAFVFQRHIVSGLVAGSVKG